ncbi:Ig-like domain-containing protein [Limnohabitans sp. WS1]|uniref:Ig-like domain-containing protein n=1 Tax=Limnohabitans sp. WS1 TaxID=1100726 RepID=UPI001304CF0A|nr:Ig-like domain-containing protein [Limnohabitans sp. WS1]
MNTAKSSQNTYKVTIKNGQSGTQQGKDLPSPADGQPSPARVKAQAGDKYQLEALSGDQRVAPDKVKLKRVGSNLHIALDEAADASLIVEDYYSVMPEGYNGVIGQAENGNLYEYAAEDFASATQASGATSPWPLDGQEMNAVLGGQAVVTSSAAVGVLAFNPLLATLGLVGAAGAAAGAGSSGNATNTETPSVTVLKLAGSADTGLVGDQITRNAQPVLTGQTAPGARLVLDIKNAANEVVATYTATADATGAYSMASAEPLGDGTYTPVLTVSADGATPVVHTGATFTIDTQAPSLVVSSDKNALLAGQSATLSFTFSEAVSDFTLDDVTVSGGTLSNLQGSGQQFTATFTATATEVVLASLSVQSERLTDVAGNPNAEPSNVVQIKLNTSANANAVLDILAISEDTGSSAKDFITSDSTLTYSGSLTGYSNNGDRVLLVLKNAANEVQASATVEPTGDRWTWTDPSVRANGQYSLQATLVDAQGKPLLGDKGQPLVQDVQSLTIARIQAASDTAIAQESGGTGDTQAGISPQGQLLANNKGAQLTIMDVALSETGSKTPVGSGIVMEGLYGSLTLQSDGTYSYKVDNKLDTVQVLRNPSDALTEKFFITVKDVLTGDSVMETLTITVQGQNDAPSMRTPLRDVSFAVGKSIAISGLAANFLDVDRNDVISLKATLADGGALPAWLSFDASTGSFSGLAPSGTAPAILDIVVTATDLAGLKVSDTFKFNLLAQPVPNGGLAPEVSILADTNNDTKLNAAEMGSASNLTVKVAFDASKITVGDRVVINAGSATQTVVIKDADMANGHVLVSLDKPAEGGTLTVTARLQDGSGGNNTASGSDSAVLDTVGPVLSSMVMDKTTLKMGETAVVTLQFSEKVQGLELGDLKADNGQLSQLSSADGGQTWTVIFTPTSDLEVASNSVTLSSQYTDLVNNPGAAGSGPNYLVDTRPPVFTLQLDDASNSASKTDRLTNDDTPTLSGTGSNGDTIEVTMPGTQEVLKAVVSGGIWQVTPTQAITSGNVTAVAKDAHGNTSAPQSLALSIDTSMATPGLTLVCDSGSSSSDKLSKDATLALANLETGALVEYSANGGSWSPTFTPKEGANSVIVRQTDAAGNVAVSSTLNFVLDTTAPATTLSISPVSGDNAMGPSDAQSATTSIVGEVSNAQDGDKVNVYVHGKTFSGTVDASGHYSIEVDTAALIADADLTLSVVVFATDAAGNTQNVSVDSSYSVDITAPTVQSLVVSKTSLKAADVATVTITFSEKVTAFDASDLSADNGIMSNLASADGGLTWTATFTANADVEDLTNAIQVGLAYTDLAGNAAVGGPGNISSNYVIDNKAPTATVQLADEALKAGETTTLTITFSEKVSNFSNADVTVANGSLGTLSSTDGIVWTGTFTPSVNLEDATNSITLASTYTDVAGNAGQSADSGNYSVDTKAPTASVTLTDNTNTAITSLTAGQSAKVTITFSEAVQDFSNADVTAPSGTLSTLASTDGGTTWTATFTPSANVEVAANSISVNPGAYSDLADNAGNAASSATYAVDTQGPTASITLSDSALTAGETAQVTISFSEKVTGFDNTDVTVENGTLSTLATTDGGKTWTGTFTPTAGTADASNLMSVANSYTDVAGNQGASTVSGNYAIDLKAPTATIALSDNALKAGESATVTITFSEKVKDFSNADVSAPNGTLSSFTASADGLIWTATFTPAVDTEAASNTLSLGTAYTDEAGNAGTVANATYAVDTKAPVFTVQLDDASNSAAKTDRLTNDSTPTISGTGTTGDIIQVTMPGTLEVLSTTVDANGKWSVTPTLVIASGNVSVTAQDAAGNTSPAQTLALVIDTAVATPTIALVCDSGTSSSDKISRDGTITVGNLEAGATVEYSTNGTTWDTTFAASENANTVYVRQTDTAGNVSAASSLSFTLDTTAPTPTVSINAIGGDDALSPADAVQTQTGITGSVTDAREGDLVKVLVNGQTFSATVDALGNYSVSVATADLIADTGSALEVVLMASDAAGNTQMASATRAYAVDITVPTVQSIVLDKSALKVGETATVTITFSEKVKAFDLSDLTAENGTLSSLATADSGLTWTATLTPTASIEDTTNVVKVLANYTDLSDNLGTAATSGNYSVETLAPTATIQLADEALKAGETTTLTITFSEKVSNFSNADVTVQNGSLGTLSSTDGIVWTGTFTPSVNLEDATNVITLASTYTDVAGNAGQSADSGNYTVDTKAPTASVTLTDNTNTAITSLTAGQSAKVTITFSEAVKDFSNADVTAPNGTLSTLASTDGGTTWTATFTPSANVEVAANSISVNPGAYSDLAANAGSAASSATYAVDTQGPTASISISDSALTAGETAQVTISFSEKVTGFDNTDVTVENGTLSTLATTDGGKTWTGTFTPTAGTADASNLMSVANSYTDVAGNQGASTASGNYAIDLKAPTATIALSDNALKAGESATVTITFSEKVKDFSNADITAPNGTLSSFTASADGLIWTATFTPAVDTEAASNTLSLATAYTDEAGNTGTVANATYAVDTKAPVFTVQLDDASNSAAKTDRLTNDSTPTISGTGTTGDIIQVTMPGTLEVLSTTVAADGKWSVTPTLVIASGNVSVTAQDAAGNTSPAQTLALVIDTAVATPTVALVCDSGTSSSDKISQSGVINVSGLEAGATVEYSIDGTTWGTTFAASEGSNTVQVRQTDAAGNVATSNAFNFTLDSQMSAFTVALSCDSGTASDKVSQDASLVITGAEVGANVAYSTDGSTWDSTYAAAEGVNNVKVRVMDAAGNQRTQDYSFTLDSTAPTAAVLTLVCDSGSQAGDQLTNNGALNVVAEAGATLEYSTNGSTWNSTFAAADGANTVSVRVTDKAGNVSSTASLSFTLDKAAPVAASVSLVCDSGLNAVANNDKISHTGTLAVQTAETAGLIEYSTDGLSWAATLAAAEGVNNVKVRVTDAAGNLGAVTDYAFTLDTQAPAAPVLGLVCDSGLLGSDKITQNGAFSATTSEVDATLQYSTDGVAWSNTFVAAEGSNTVKARVMDAAGNAGAASTLSFTLDTLISKPSVALSCDSGASSSDKITRSGALSLNNVDSDAQVQYSTDGQNWTSSFTAVEGSNSVSVKVTDAAGNVATSDTLVFQLRTLDAVFTLKLDNTSNSGSQTDLVTNDVTPTISGTGTTGDIIQVTMPGTGEVLSTTVAADGKWSVTPTMDVASGSVSVTATNAAGVVSAPKTLPLVIDTAVATPTVALVCDSGASSSDKISRDSSLVVGNLEAGSTVEYSSNGTTWGTTFAATETVNTVYVRQTDTAGNVSASSSLSFTLDTAASAFTLALACDTATAGDKISSDGTLALSGVEAGAVVSYSTNGGTSWSNTFAAVEGANSVSVRTTDVAGNERIQDLAFSWLKTKPLAPVLTLVCDSGLSGSDAITHTDTLQISTSVGTTLLYSTDASTWSNTFTAIEGANTVYARAVDAAGNLSDTSVLAFTLDITAPLPVTIGLTCDSGSNNSDKISQNGTLAVNTAETGGLIEYSVNGGAWGTTFTAAEGLNSVKTRLTDTAGNVSSLTTYSFTLDTAAPAAPVLALVCDSGSLGGDKVTHNGAVSSTTLESGASVQYSLDGSAWGTTFAAVEGSNTVKSRVVDAAGNEGAVSTLSFTLDTQVSKPTVSLVSDTGLAGDKITANGQFTVSGADAETVLSYSTNGTVWSNTFMAAEGANALYVRATDVAGNSAVSDVFNFVLNTQSNNLTATLATTSNSGSLLDLITSDDTPTINGTGTAGDRVQVTLPGTGEILTATVDASGQWSVTPLTAIASGDVSVVYTGPSTTSTRTLALVIDKSIAAPGLSLACDSGSSASDKISNSASFSVSNQEAGATLEYSTNGSAWSTTFTATEGANTVFVRQTDAAGNVATSSVLNFTLDTTAPTPTLTVSPVVGDDAIGPVDAQALTSTIEGAVTNAREGDKVSVFVRGKTFTSTVDASGHYSVDVTTADLVADSDKTLSVVVYATDAAGNTQTGSINHSYTVDTGAPTVQSLSISKASLKAGDTATVTITLSEKVLGFDLSDISADNGVLSNLATSDGGQTWSATFTANANVEDSTNVVQVGTAFTDISGNGALSGASNTSNNYAIDSKAPTATIQLANEALKAGQSTTLTITFSEKVADFSNADVTVANGSLGTLSSADEGKTWTGSFTPATNMEDASNVITLANTYTDLAGNTGSTGVSGNYTLDTLAPTAVVSLKDGQGADITGLSTGQSASVTITFNEAVKDFSNADVTAPNGTLSTLTSTDDGKTWTATFTATSAVESGANGITVNAGGYSDLAGNLGGTAASGNFAVDTQGPTATITLSDSTLNAGETAQITISFNEKVKDFDSTDVTVQNGTLGTLATTDGGKTWVGTFTPTTGVQAASNTVSISNAYTDLVGNQGSSQVSANYSVDRKAPTASISLSDTALQAGESATVTITFSEKVSSFTNADVTAENGTLGTFASTDGITWTAQFTPSASTQVAVNTLSLATSYTDEAGNTGTAASAVYAVDTRAPAFVAKLDVSSNSGVTTDLITSDDTPTISGTGTAGDRIEVTMPGTNEMLSTVVGSDGSWTVTPTQAISSGNVSIVAKNPSNVSSLPQLLALTIDKTIATPGLSLACDSGNSASDKVSSSASLTVSGVEAGAVVEYSTNGSVWGTTFTATEGVNTVSVRQTDAAGNVATSSVLNFTLDTTAPTPVVTVSPIAGDDAIGPVDAQATTTTIVGEVTNALAGDKVSVFVHGQTFTGTVDASGHYSVEVTTANLVADSDKSISVVVDATDAAGNTKTGIASQVYSVDTGAPTVQSLSISKPALKAGDTATVTITFSEKVTAFDLSDISADNGVLSNLATSDSGQTWSATFTANANVEDTTNVVQVGTAFTDLAGNTAISSASNTSSNYVIDSKAPTATIKLANEALKAGDATTLTITFSEKVADFSNTDVTVANGSLGTLSSADGGITWTGTFTPTANLEDVTNVITLANTYTDLAGNTGSDGTSGNYTIDTQAPSATVTLKDGQGADITSLTAGQSANVTITFNEAVKDFSNADVSAPNGTLSTLSSADGGKTWTATFTATSATEVGANGITVNSGAYSDLAGNQGGTAASGNFAVDTQGPTATIGLSDTALTAGETAVVTISFNEKVKDFDNSDVTVQNGTLSTLSTTDGGKTWVGTFTPDAGVVDATNTISLSAAYTDLVGNQGSSATSPNYAIDRQAPAASIAISDTALKVGETATVTVTFSEKVLGFSKADMSSPNGSLSDFTASTDGLVWTATFTPTQGVESASNSLSLATSYTDEAGNTGTAASATYAVDTLAPSFTVQLATSSNSGSTADLVTSDDTPTLSGTGSNGDQIKVTLPGTNEVLTTVVAAGVWSVTAQKAMASGTVSVVATDAAGNISAAQTLTLTIDKSVATPTLSLTCDSGFSSSDKITNQGAITTGNLESGALLEYSTDGSTWDVTFAATEGSNTVMARQTDVAGNISATVSLSFLLDTSKSVSVFTIDDVTNANTLNLSESGEATTRITGRATNASEGDTVELMINNTPYTGTLDSALAFSIEVDTADLMADGDTKIAAKLLGSDPAGNNDVTNQTKTYSIDTTPSSFAMALGTSSNSGLTNDLITSDTTPTVVGLGTADDTIIVTFQDTGEILSTVVAADGSWSVTPTLGLFDGSRTVSAVVKDPAGNVSSAQTLTLVIDTSTTKPVFTLACDSGNSASDLITKQAGLSAITGIESGASVEYKVDSGSFGSSYTAPSTNGVHTVVVRSTDAAGNVSTESLTFTLDLEAPIKPTISLVCDTGTFSADKVTYTSEIKLDQTFAPTDTVEYRYSTNSGVTFTAYDSLFLPTTSGTYLVQARVTDVVGNQVVSDIFTFNYDITAPNAPVVALYDDNGVNASDKKTNDPTLVITGGDTGIGDTYQYSINGGTTWTSSFNAQTGPNNLLVRIKDLAGNNSNATAFSFDYNNAALAPSIVLQMDSGYSSSDKLTNVSAVGVTDAASTDSFQFSFDGFTWASSYTAPTVDGAYDLRVRRIDEFGNISPNTTLSFVRDTTGADINNVTSTSPNVAYDILTASGGFGVGDTFNVTINLNEAVVAGSYMIVKFDTGQKVVVTAATNGSTLTGTYAVGSNESSTDLNVVDIVKVALTDLAGNTSTTAAIPSLSNFGDNKDISIRWGLMGTTGNDQIDGMTRGTGTNDDYNGLDGSDTMDYSGSALGFSLNLATGVASGGDIGIDSIVGFEHASGGTGNDTLVGDAQANVLSGGAGNDSLDSGLGNDTLIGGLGNDSVDGGGGTDWMDYSSAAGAVSGTLTGASDAVFTDGDGGTAEKLRNIENILGSAANDNLGGDGSDNIFLGEAGNDTLLGGAGNDSLGGGTGNDSLDGGSGNDTFNGGIGDDVLIGGTNIDWADYSAAPSGLKLNLSTSIAADGSGGVDTLSQIENVAGTAFDDVMVGDAGDNRFVGGAGDDSLQGGQGSDTLEGGAGNDWALYGENTLGVTVDLVAGTASGNAGSDFLVAIENLQGGSADDYLAGDGLANILDGGMGNDTLNGGAGNNTLIGGGGADLVVGSSGHDSIVTSAGSQVIGGAGNDTIMFENIGQNFSNVSIDGGLGTDVLRLSGFNQTFNVFGLDGSSNRVAAPISKIEVIDLGNGLNQLNLADSLETVEFLVNGAGTASLLRIDGDNGKVFLAAGWSSVGTGVTTVIGGSTYDLYSNAVVSGNDTLAVKQGIEVTYPTTLTPSNDNYSGDEKANYIDAMSGNDSINGLGGDDTIRGGLGLDTLDGGAGNDWLDFGDASLGTASVNVNLSTGVFSSTALGNDLVSNFEHVSGGAGNDTIVGTTADNWLKGGTGNDSILSGAGNDTLTGGLGNDWLDAEAGTADWADYSNATGAVTVSLSAATAGAATTSGADGVDTLRGIENLIGGVAADRLVGDNNANYLIGGLGADTLQATGGNDTLSGQDGDDSLVGGSGADLFEAELGNDTYTGGDTSNGGPNDTLNLSAFNGNYVVLGSSPTSDLTISGGSTGTDRASYIDVWKFGNGNITFNNLTGLSNTTWNETVITGSGNDSIWTGNGRDYIMSGAGNDTINGSLTGTVDTADLDTMDAGPGEDWLSYQSLGTSVWVTLEGGSTSWQTVTLGGSGSYIDYVKGFEHILTDAGADRIWSGSGNSSILAGAGADYVSDLQGDNYIDVGKSLSGSNDGSADTVIAGTGNDTIITGGGVYELINAGDGNNLIDVNGTTSYGDSITSGSGNDTILGIWGGYYNRSYSTAYYGAQTASGFVNAGDGNNYIKSASGAYYFAENVTTGSGNDYIDVTGGRLDEFASDTVFSGAGNDTVYAGGAYAYNYPSGQSIELQVVDAGDGDDQVFAYYSSSGGSYNSNSIMGGAGNDTLSSTGGSTNVIDGGLGNDSMVGGTGTDTMKGGAGNDTIAVFSGTDTVDAGDGNDVVTSSGTGTLRGGAGDDQLVHSGTSAIYLFGEAGNDTVISGTGSDSLEGGSGNDSLFSAGGADTMRAGDGDDTLGFGGGSRIFGDAGNDRIVANGGVASSTVWGGAADDFIDMRFDTLGDTIFGDDASILVTDGKDSIYGGSGTDSINSGGADDYVSAGAGNDVVFGGEGGDYLLGDGGNDSMDGGLGDDRLDGGVGNDTLLGGAGYDTITMGDGSNVVQGGTGSDLFVYDATWASDLAAADTVDGGAGIDAVFFTGVNQALDLTAAIHANANWVSVERIDLTGAGNNTLKLAAQDVLDLTDMTAATAVLMIDGNAGDALDMSSFGLAVGAVNALNKLTSAKSISMDFNGNGTFDIGETATSDATGLITFNNGFRGNQTYQIWQAGSGNATFNGMILLIDSDVAFTGI